MIFHSPTLTVEQSDSIKSREYSFEKVVVTVELSGDEVEEEIFLVFRNEGEGIFTGLTYSVVGKIDDLKVMDREGEIESKVENRGKESVIRCEFREPVGPRETYELTMRFRSKSFVITNNYGMRFSPTYSFDAPVRDFDLKVIIPRKMCVSPPISPPPDKVYSSGDDLIFEWNVSDLEVGNVFSTTLGYEAKKEDEYSPLYFLFGIILLSPVTLLLIRRERRKGRNIIMSLLLDDERIVIEEIIKRGGVIEQNELYNVTGFSKPKISRITSDLEERGIIEKERYGRTNRIRIKREFMPML